MILFALKPGVTVAEAETFVKERKVKGDPNNTAKLGSIVADVEANPGQKSEAQTELQAGHYLVLVGAGEGEAVAAHELRRDRRQSAGRAAGAGSDDPLDRVRLPRPDHDP